MVMNEVRVSSPYLPENVSGGTSAANERVKKVVSAYCNHIYFLPSEALSVANLVV